MKPDLSKMSKEELREYIISHQDDQEAFYQYIDLLKSHPSTKVYPSSLSPDEIKQAVVHYVQKKEDKENS